MTTAANRPMEATQVRECNKGAAVFMRWVTFLLALLTASSVVALVRAVFAAEWRLIAIGGGCLVAGVLLAAATESMRERIADIGPSASNQRSTSLAFIGSILPVLALVSYTFLVLDVIERPIAKSHWLFVYGIATGPWMIVSFAVRLRLPTLCRVDALMGHLLFLAMSFALLPFPGAGVVSALITVMLAVPPAIVGVLATRAGLSSLSRPVG